MTGQRKIQENQISDFALKKAGGEVTDADLDPGISSYSNGLLEVNRTRPGGPALSISNSISSELQLVAANGAFQINNLGHVNGQLINNTTILTPDQKTKLTGGSSQNADALHSHSIPTFFHYHGTISDGAQLQLPPGFNADQVHYIVSARHYEIDNLVAGTSLQFDCGIDENRFVSLEIKQPKNGSNVAVNASLNYYITGYKLGGSQSGGPVASGAAPMTRVKTALGYWDGEADIDFRTGIISIKPTSVSFYNNNGSLIPRFDYLGDIFDDPNFPPPKVIWTIVNENNTTYNGGISDRSWINGIGNIGGENSQLATLNSYTYSGGIKSQFITSSDSQYCGRLAFFAISVAIL